MGQLAGCLKKIGLEQHEAAIIRGKIAEQGPDKEAHAAAVAAVKGHLADLNKQFSEVAKEVAKIRAYDAEAKLHPKLSQESETDPKAIPPAARRFVKLNPLFAQRTGSEEVPADLQPAFAARVRSLIESGVPAMRLDGIDSFHTYDGGPDARFFPIARSIGIRRDALERIHLNSVLGPGDPLAAVVSADLAHELRHNEDFADDNSMSATSAAFAILDVSTGREAVGHLVKEALHAFQNTENDVLERYLRYPLSLWKSPDRMTGDRMTNSMIKEELYAQLGALYDTNPVLLREEMPQAYNLFDSINKAYESSKTIDDVRRAVRGALQASAPAMGVAAVEQRGNPAGDRSGIAKERAGPGVGRAESDGRNARVSRGIDVEVAPNPLDVKATERFNKLLEAERREATRHVARRIIGQVLRNMGVTAETEHTIGGFMGATQPSLNLRFSKNTPFETMVEVGKVLGSIFSQKAIIAYDEGVTSGDGVAGFIRVRTDRAFSYEEQQKLFAEIRANMPEAEGFAGHDGTMVFGNYGNLTDKEFHEKLDAALAQTTFDGDLRTAYKQFRSSWVEPVTLEGTRYAQSQQGTGEAGGTLPWGPRDIDALREETGRILGQHFAYADAARAEEALVRKLARLNRHLTSEEKDLLFKTRRDKLVAILDEIPAAPNEFAHAALAGKAAKGWYERTRKAVERFYGQDAPRFLSLMAALSPQTSVRENFYNAARVWSAWLDANRTTDPNKLKRIFNENLLTPKGLEDAKSAMKAWSINGTTALTTISPEKTKLSGPKVESFRRNLQGDAYEVTQDRHMANFAGILQKLLRGMPSQESKRGQKGPGYIAMNIRVRQAADLIERATGETWAPAEVQETVWSFWKALDDLTQAKGETRSALELLRSGEITHELVARITDLGSFFNEEEYRAITGGVAQGRGVDLEEAARQHAAEARPLAQTGPIAATPHLERVARRVDRKIATAAEEKERKAEAKAVKEGAQFSLDSPTWSAAFKKWFGDSKVVDAEGKPLVVYHGTEASRVSENSNGEHEVINQFYSESYFSENPQEASSYALNESTLYPVYLSLRHPFVTNDYDFFAEAYAGAVPKLIKDGFDGVIYDEGGKRQFLAFHPNQIKSAIGNSGTFSAENPDIRFSWTEVPAGEKFAPLPTERVQAIADSFSAKFANAAPIIVVPDVASLPFNAPERARGAHHNGTVYLVAENLESPHAVQFTILHEQLGHYGLRSILGDTINSLMESIYDSNANVRELADARRARSEGMTKALAAEEALSDLAGTGQIQSLPQWKMILASIRNALRSLGFNVAFSDNDIVALLANSRKFVEKGRDNSLPAQVERWRDHAVALSEKAPIFYSALAANIGKAPFSKAGEIQAAQLKTWIAARVKDGLFKQDEVTWSGLDELLQIKDKVSRDEINAFLDQNRPRVEETVLGETSLPEGMYLRWDEAEGERIVVDDFGTVLGRGMDAPEAANNAASRMEREGGRFAVNGDPEKAQRLRDKAEAIRRWVASYSYDQSDATKFSGWQLEPHGKDYRELLITLPPSTQRARSTAGWTAKEYGSDESIAPSKNYEVFDASGKSVGRFPGYDSPAEAIAHAERYDRVAPERARNRDFTQGHFDQPNVLAHIRFNERVAPDGKRVLFVEEIQSDWAQKGREKGFGGTKPPEPVTELPTGWTLKEYAPRRVTKRALAKRFNDAYGAFIRQGRLAGVFGVEGFARNFPEGSPERERVLNMQQTFRAELDLKPGRNTGLVQPGMSAKEAFDAYAELIRARLVASSVVADNITLTDNIDMALDQLDDLGVMLRESTGEPPKKWGVFSPNNNSSAYSSEATAEEAKASALKSINKERQLAWEYANKSSIPSAPFVQKTDAWVTLAAKRIIRYAAEHGFDHVAWTTGEEQTTRYESGLRKHVDRIDWEKTPEGIQIVGKMNGRTIVDTTQKENSLSDAIGKLMADKIINDPSQTGTIRGNNIRVDDVGMSRFYGGEAGMTKAGTPSLVTGVIGKLLKKYGGETVGSVPVVIREASANYEVKPTPMTSGTIRGTAGAEGPRRWAVYRNGEQVGVMNTKGQAEGLRDLLLAQDSGKAVGDLHPGFDMTDSLKESALSGFPLFSLATDGVMGSLTQQVLDRLQWSASKFNWINKGVNTQRHLAQINPDFRPVYQGIQRYLQDTAALASDAATVIGDDILPQLKKFGDVLKNTSPAKTKQLRADMQAVGKVIFAGTLNDIPPTPEQLRNGFEATVRDQNGQVVNTVQAPALNPRQIAMYERVRKGLDLSLAQASASEMIRLTRGDAIDDARKQAKEDPERAAQILAIALRERYLWATEIGEEGIAAAADASLTKVQDLYADLQSLKNRGYAPLMRFGPYAIDIFKVGEGGELTRTGFVTADTRKEANRLLRELQQEFPDAVLKPGTMNPEAWRAMKGMSIDSMEAYAHATGMDKNEAVQEYLKLMVSSRSIMKRLIARKGYSGYSEDLPRVLAGFVTSQARFAARNYHMGDVMRARYNIPEASGDVRGAADSLISYINSPTEEAHALRGLLFVNYIGGSIASALTNITQPVMQTLPWLTQFGPSGLLNTAKAAKIASDSLWHGVETMLHPERGSASLQEAMKLAAREGITEPQEIHQLHAETIRGLGSSLTTRRVIRAWGSAFSLAESFNRKVTFNAAFEMAERVGMDAINAHQVERGLKKGVPPVTFASPFEFAEFAVEETQGIYNKGNRPGWSRNAIGATIFTFKQFSIAYVEFLMHLPPREKLLALAFLALGAGAEGLPFADDMEDLLDTIGQSLGFATNSKKAVRDWAVKHLGETLGPVLTGGVSNAPYSPINVAGRFSMGNLIPGTAFFARSTTDRATELANITGPLGSFLTNVSGAYQSIQDDQFGRAAVGVLPRAFGDFIKAVDMAQTGQYRDFKGRKVIDTTGADVLFKAIGIQPGDVAQAQARASDVRQDVALHSVVETSLADRWARGVIDNDPDAVQKAIRDLLAWNIRNPEQRIAITPDQIRRRVREATMERSVRLTRSSPKEIRGAIAESLQR
jgi:hypothetical protein